MMFSDPMLAERVLGCERWAINLLLDDKLCSDPLSHYPFQLNGAEVYLGVIQRSHIWVGTSGGQAKREGLFLKGHR